jgi:hypothetical protein
LWNKFRNTSSTKRYALIEYSDENDATEALKLNGTILKSYYISVIKSRNVVLGEAPSYISSKKKTGQTQKIDRTIYVSNIDPKVIEFSQS